MKFYEVYTDPGYIESDGQHSIVQASDKGSPCKWKGLNNKKKRVIKYRVDGGIITSMAESKCDYAVYVEGDASEYIGNEPGGDAGQKIEAAENGKQQAGKTQEGFLFHIWGFLFLFWKS